MITLREAIEFYKNAEPVSPDGPFEVVFAAAIRWLALTETGPDYEAAAVQLAIEVGHTMASIDPPKAGPNTRRIAHSVVDAALADYLTGRP